MALYPLRFDGSVGFQYGISERGRSYGWVRFQWITYAISRAVAGGGRLCALFELTTKMAGRVITQPFPSVPPAEGHVNPTTVVWQPLEPCRRTAMRKTSRVGANDTPRHPVFFFFSPEGHKRCEQRCQAGGPPAAQIFRLVAGLRKAPDPESRARVPHVTSSVSSVVLTLTAVWKIRRVRTHDRHSLPPPVLYPHSRAELSSLGRNRICVFPNHNRRR